MPKIFSYDIISEADVHLVVVNKQGKPPQILKILKKILKNIFLKLDLKFF